MANLLLFLTSTTNAPVDSDSILDKLIPNFWAFIINLAAFIVMCLIVLFFAYKPVKKILKQRHDYVQGNIKNSEDNLKISENKILKAEATIKESKKEAEDIINAAKVAANRVSDEIINNAKEDAKKEVLKAKEEINYEVEKSKDDIHKEIVDVSLLASEKILEREINKEDNEKIINDFINELKKDN